MELKYLVVLCVLGVASGFKIPEDKLESTFPSSYSANPSATAAASAVPLPEEEEPTRHKRHLFKKKGKGESITFNRYEHGSTYEPRPHREVHVHHYPVYPQQQPSYVEHRWEPRPAPSQQQYHHYHGYNEGSYGNQGYYSAGYAGGNYYSKPAYGNGGYAQYGNAPPQQGPIGAVPIATGHNNVDRGQGAAAVNNIAIIHARAGQTTNNALEESKLLPKPLPIDFDEISREALGMD